MKYEIFARKVGFINLSSVPIIKLAGMQSACRTYFGQILRVSPPEATQATQAQDVMHRIHQK
jgi:hypothetical protein